MQREGGDKMKLNNQREAFSLMVAVAVIVIMGTVSMLVMSMSSKIVKETTTQYRKEQAVLLAKSYTEYAVLAVMGNDRINDTCLTDIDANDIIADSNEGKGYKVRVRIAYIGDSGVDKCSNSRVLSNSVATPESSLNIIVDVYVEYREMDIEYEHKNEGWVTYHRRTMQKIWKILLIDQRDLGLQCLSLSW